MQQKKLSEFFAKNGITEFQIWHSPQKRARLTGEILKELLQISCKNFVQKNFLDCDYYEIQKNLPVEQVFTLMISHQPDVEYYLENKYNSYQSVYNCDVFIGSQKL
jgi:phosphohistidine phosphatase SixA